MNKFLIRSTLIVAQLYGISNCNCIQRNNIFYVYQKYTKFVTTYAVLIALILIVQLLNTSYFIISTGGHVGNVLLSAFTLRFILTLCNLTGCYYIRIVKHHTNFQIAKRFLKFINLFNTTFNNQNSNFFHLKIVRNLNILFLLNYHFVALLAVCLAVIDGVRYKRGVYIIIPYVSIYFETIIFYDFTIILTVLIIVMKFLNNRLEWKIREINKLDSFKYRNIKNLTRVNIICELCGYMDLMMNFLNRISKLIGSFNTYYAFQMVLFLMAKTAKAITQSFHTYFGLQRPSNNFWTSGKWYYPLSTLFYGMYVSIHTETLFWLLYLFRRQVDKTVYLLDELRPRRSDERLRATLNLFRIQMEHFDFDIAPYKLFTVNKHLLYSMIAYAVNGLIILIQFQKSSDSKA